MPSDTDSALLGLRLQATGNNDNSWGDILNDSTIQLIENAIAAMSTVAVTGAGTTLSAVQRRAAIIQFTGTLVGNEVVTVANLTKSWIVYNNTSGAFTLKFKTAGGSASAEIRQGGWSRVWCDGADVLYVGASSKELSSQMLAANGTVSLPGYSFASDPDSGVYRIGANNLGVAVNGAKVLDIATTGLDVVGLLTENGRRPVPIGMVLDYAGHTEPNGWAFPCGQAISRSTFSLLFAALTKTVTGSTNSSTTLSSISEDVRNRGFVGAYIEGTGIPTGTTITAIAATTFTISQAATASAGGLTFRILPFGQGDASTTFNLPDVMGRVVAGRDDMSGTSQNRLTAQTAGVDGDKIGAAGGAETHQLTAAQLAAHSHTSPALTDPGHTHALSEQVYASGFSAPQAGSSGALLKTVTATSNTTGITLAANTGSAGSDAAHNNVQPTTIMNKIIFLGVYS